MDIESWKALSSHQQQAMFTAIVVRNAMEEFHCNHLSDEQMAELNPIIRNAIVTALDIWDEVTLVHPSKAPRWALESFGWNVSCIPDYWETPVSRASEIKAGLEAPSRAVV